MLAGVVWVLLAGCMAGATAVPVANYGVDQRLRAPLMPVTVEALEDDNGYGALVARLLRDGTTHVFSRELTDRVAIGDR